MMMNLGMMARKSGRILAAAGIAVIVAAAFMSLAGENMFTRPARTSLTIDYPLALSYIEAPPAQAADAVLSEHEQAMAALTPPRRVEAVVHHYAPAQLVVFKGRNYMPMSGWTYKFDGKTAKRLDAAVTYFLTREKDDRLSPIKADFAVDWRLEGRAENGPWTPVKRGRFKGSLAEDRQRPSMGAGLLGQEKNIAGDTVMVADFSESDAKFRRGESGAYQLRLMAKTAYGFDQAVGEKIKGVVETTILKARVAYNKNERGRVALYYPLNSITKKTAVAHPAWLAVKSQSKTVFAAGFLLLAMAGLSAASVRLTARAATA